MLAPGTMLGVFRIDRQIARGGMGIVYEATDTSLGRRVAVKVLSSNEADEETRERFRREARALAQIENDHIVRVFAVGDVENGLPYVVMELLAGRTLESRLEDGPLPVREVVHDAKQILAALVTAHAAGLVHRDLKPSNLFLVDRPGRSPVLKVLDFGVAKHLYAPQVLTQTGQALGSPAYMSPEQLNAQRDLDARTDVWSLGVTLYELLVGSLPFQGSNVAQVTLRITTQPAPSIVARRSDVPRALDAIVQRCLEKDREKRFPSASSMLEALASIPVETKRRRSSTATFVVALSAVLLAAGSALGAYLVFGHFGAPTPVADAAADVVFAEPSVSVVEVEPAPSASSEAPSASVPAPRSRPSLVDRPTDLSKVRINVSHPFANGWARQHQYELADCLLKRSPPIVKVYLCAPHEGAPGAVGTCITTGNMAGVEVSHTTECVAGVAEKWGYPMCTLGGECPWGIWIQLAL